MNDNYERRRSNRAILMVVGMAFAAIALNDGVHALTTHSGKRAPERTTHPRVEQSVPCDDTR